MDPGADRSGATPRAGRLQPRVAASARMPTDSAAAGTSAVTVAELAVLREAIARNVPVILSVPADGAGEARRSRLLGESAGGAAGAWVESVPGQQHLIDALIAVGKPIGVSFRSGEHLVRFRAVVVRRDPAYRLSDAVTVEAMLLNWPADVELTQRRSGYRVKRPLDAEVALRAWMVSADAPLCPAVPQPGAKADPTEVRAELRDLSVGGLGVLFTPPRGGRLKLAAGDRLRLELSAGGRSVSASAKIRYTPRTLPDGSLRAGLDFEGMTDTLEGRRTLALVAQLVAEFQRTEARRRRAG